LQEATRKRDELMHEVRSRMMVLQYQCTLPVPVPA
jgi:hypothetical protein